MLENWKHTSRVSILNFDCYYLSKKFFFFYSAKYESKNKIMMTIIILNGGIKLRSYLRNKHFITKENPQKVLLE